MGRLCAEVDAAIRFAEKNGAYGRAHAFLIYRAWVQLHAMDGAGVLAIGERCCRASKSLHIVRGVGSA